MLKSRGMGKAMKSRYAEGGTVNAAQRAFGPTIFQRDERRKRAAIDEATGTTNETPRVTGESPAIKRRVVDEKTKAKQDAQFKALMKKHEAPL